jgi:hypothetical protein
MPSWQAGTWSGRWRLPVRSTPDLIRRRQRSLLSLAVGEASMKSRQDIGAAQLGIRATLSTVEDFHRVAACRIMMTPALGDRWRGQGSRPRSASGGDHHLARNRGHAGGVVDMRAAKLSGPVHEFVRARGSMLCIAEQTYLVG